MKDTDSEYVKLAKQGGRPGKQRCHPRAPRCLREELPVMRTSRPRPVDVQGHGTAWDIAPSQGHPPPARGGVPRGSGHRLPPRGVVPAPPWPLGATSGVLLGPRQGLSCGGDIGHRQDSDEAEEHPPWPMV